MTDQIDQPRPSEEVHFHTRKWVKPEDLNANGTLFLSLIPI